MSPVDDDQIRRELESAGMVQHNPLRFRCQIIERTFTPSEDPRFPPTVTAKYGNWEEF